MQVSVDLSNPKHGIIRMREGYFMEELTAGEAEALIKEIRDAINQVRSHNRPTKKIGEY